jgi:hypothetical protein
VEFWAAMCEDELADEVRHSQGGQARSDGPAQIVVGPPLHRCDLRAFGIFFCSSAMMRSNRALVFEKPLIGRLPDVVVNMNSPLKLGSDLSRSRAIGDNGTS